MGRRPCCDKFGLKKGQWTADEDKKLINFILNNAPCSWRALPKLAGLLRCGKSCRLRWINYLRPDLKRGLLSEDEEKMVIDLHAQLGNRWSKIASQLPGRTDNEIKNYWNTYIKKKLTKMGIDHVTHKPLSAGAAKEEPLQKPAEVVVPACNEIPVIEGHETVNETSTSPSSSSNCYSGGAWATDAVGDLEISAGFEDYYSELLNDYIWNDEELMLLPDYDASYPFVAANSDEQIWKHNLA